MNVYVVKWPFGTKNNEWDLFVVAMNKFQPWQFKHSSTVSIEYRLTTCDGSTCKANEMQLFVNKNSQNNPLSNFLDYLIKYLFYLPSFTKKDFFYIFRMTWTLKKITKFFFNSRVGDILYLTKDENVPCDAVVLATSHQVKIVSVCHSFIMAVAYVILLSSC